MLGGIVSFNAQQITGTVKDENGNKISYLEISATKDSIKQNTLSDENGNFMLKLPANGNYLLKIYRDAEETLSKNILVNGDVLQNFEIADLKTTQLQEVVITAKKKIVEQVGDKTYFNVENSLLSKGNSGLDILQKSPKLSINSEGQLLLKNKNALVLINGRKTNLSGEDLNTYLSSLNSEDIKRIEIQDVSSSNQDANTSGGVVNIVLKKIPKGFKAIAKTFYLYRKMENASHNGSLNLNYGAEKFNVYSSLNYTTFQNSGNSEGSFNYSDQSQNINKTDINLKNKYFTASMGGMYFPNENNEIGIEGYYSKTKTDMLFNGNLNIYNHASLITNSLNHSLTYTDADLWYITANYNLKTDNKGSSLKFIAETGKNNSTPYNRVSTEYPSQSAENSDYLFNANSSSQYYTLQGDWIQKFEKDWELNVGAKFGNIKRDNLLQVTYLQSDEWISDSNQNQNFNNNENIMAGYVSLSKKWGKHYIKTGLRSENTNITGLNRLNNEDVKQNYTQFFPTIFYKFEINKDQTFTASYRKSISRPSFRNLNPFVIKENDFLYQIGNPDLKPYYTNYAELAYTFKKHSFSVYGVKTSDLIQGVYFTDENLINYYQSQNFGKRLGTGLDYSYNANLTKWLYTNISAGVYYNYFDSENGVKNSGASFYNSIYAQIKLPKDYVIELNNQYSHKGISYNVDFASYYRMDISVRKSFMDENLITTLKVNDVFNTSRDKNTSYFNDFNFDFYQKMISRSYMLQFQYTFDNKKNIKSGTVKTDAESRNRL